MDARDRLRAARDFPRDQLARWRLSRLVQAELPAIRLAARDARAQVDRSAPPRVYVFWAQSMEDAPDVIRFCRARLQAAHAPDELVVLDRSSLLELVDIPPPMLRKVEDDLPMLADVLRLELLLRYGGVWADASCLALANLISETRPLLRSGFFAFAREDRPLASWFLASTPGDYVVAMWRAAMHAYWRRFDRKIHYFVIQLLFEALCRHDAEFRRRWDATPRISADAAHELQFAMRDPYDEARLRDLLGASFVHKLTHKLEDDDMAPTTMLGRLVRDGLAADQALDARGTGLP